jgi:hypothetical protein
MMVRKNLLAQDRIEEAAAEMIPSSRFYGQVQIISLLGNRSSSRCAWSYHLEAGVACQGVQSLVRLDFDLKSRLGTPSFREKTLRCSSAWWFNSAFQN